MADFAYSPNYVHKHPPEFNVEVTPSKSLKQTRYKYDDNYIQRYTLHFGDVNATTKDNLWNHFLGQDGPFSSFSWSSPPSYVESGAVTVNYDEASPNQGFEMDTPQVGGNVFTITLHFVRIVSS